MIVKSIAETSYSGMFKVSFTEGAAFFVRQEYLHSIDVYDIVPEKEYSEEQTNELLDAGLTSAVELKAIEYLARAEQSRFGLNRKLIEKKYNKKYIQMALDYLEQKNYLSDERFSRAWLHSRKTNHFEGRTRLLAELQNRGISKDISTAMVEEFFSENDEYEICKKAYERLVKRGKSDEKLVAAMLQAGFSYKLIKQVQEED